MSFDQLRADAMRRARLWNKSESAVARSPTQIDDHVRQIQLEAAAEAIASPIHSKVAMRNTGARGFAAEMKTLAAELRAGFAQLHEETRAEMIAQKGHLETGKQQLEEMKKDTAELREALGLQNDPNP
jgi:hypothetical protein